MSQNKADKFESKNYVNTRKISDGNYKFLISNIRREKTPEAKAKTAAHILTLICASDEQGAEIEKEVLGSNIDYKGAEK